MKKPSIPEKLVKNPSRTLIPPLFGLLVAVILAPA